MKPPHLTLKGTVVASLVGIAASPALAGEVEKSLEVSGHINRAVVVSDNGENTTFASIDNSSVSGSRFRLKGSAKSEGLTFSTLIELGVQSNNATGTHANADSPSINLRHSYVSAGNHMGTLSLGHTGTADADFTSKRINGTGEAGFYDDSVVSGEELRISNDTGTASGVTVGDILSDSTVSRADSIKYQSPDFGGFKATVGYADTNHGGASLEYAADYDGTKVVAAAGWGSRGGTAAVDAVWGGSLGVSLAGGLNGSIAYSKRDLNGTVAANAGLNNPEMIGASIGYTSGANGITAWYQQVEDLGANGNESESYALVVQHNLSAYGASVYGGIQNVDYSTTADQYDDLTAGWVGVKVTF